MILGNRHWRWAILGAVCGVAAGCGPATEEERAYLDARQAEIERREDLQRTLQGTSEESAAIAMVKEAPAEGGALRTEAWVRRQTDAHGGTVLFPHWQALRRGVGRYEVQFTYTLMDGQGDVQKKGYAWSADLVLRLVQPPRELKPEEAGPPASRYFRRSRRPEAPPEELRLD